MKIPPVVLLAFVATGCVWGARVSKLAPAQGPRGDSVSVTVANRQRPIRGELYAVDSIDVYIATPDLGRVPWTRIASVRAHGADRTFFPNRQRLAQDQLTILALLSRFPQGLDSTRLAAVLAARRQSELKPIE